MPVYTAAQALDLVDNRKSGDRVSHHVGVKPGATNAAAILAFLMNITTTSSGNSLRKTFERCNPSTPTALTPEKLNSRSAADEATAMFDSATDNDWAAVGNPLWAMGGVWTAATTIFGRGWMAPRARAAIVLEPGNANYIANCVEHVVVEEPSVCSFIVFAEPDVNPAMARHRRRCPNRAGEVLIGGLCAGLNGSSAAGRPKGPSDQSSLEVAFLQPLAWPDSVIDGGARLNLLLAAAVEDVLPPPPRIVHDAVHRAASW